MLPYSKVDAALQAHEDFTEGPFVGERTSDRTYRITYRHKPVILIDRYVSGWSPMVLASRDLEIPFTLLKMVARVVRSTGDAEQQEWALFAVLNLPEGAVVRIRELIDLSDPTLCHCGTKVMALTEPYEDREDWNEGLWSGYCHRCATVRCDAFPGACETSVIVTD